MKVAEEHVHLFSGEKLYCFFTEEEKNIYRMYAERARAQKEMRRFCGSIFFHILALVISISALVYSVFT